MSNTNIFQTQLVRAQSSCFTTKNCAHIMAVRSFKGETIKPNLTHNLSELGIKKRGNKSVGRKYRHNLPQSDHDLMLIV